MKKVAVFCGSNHGNDVIYNKFSSELAMKIFERKWTLIYGGGAVGLMGVIADKVLELGGEVIGVIPEKLSGPEIAHKNLSKLHIVKTMHERKAMMAEMADCFIALPGGIGTLEELIEVFTWSQLGFHSKPCGILNIHGFYNKLYDFLKEMCSKGFLSEFHFNNLLFEKDVDQLLNKLTEQKISYQPKWVK